MGLLTIACARLLGAEQIFVVDHHPYRLRFAAERYGAIPINFDEDNDAAEKSLSKPQASAAWMPSLMPWGLKPKAAPRKPSSATLKLRAAAVKRCVRYAAVRRGGVVSVPGVYAGFIHGFLFGDAFDKGLSFKMGQTHVHARLASCYR